ncbi:hypothetical protein ACSX1A_15655 [Pontibacter sp. MBLB2868]|uniref:hypothetical protein n=1 Tax=Pontibacter sp. MBLB2868 TaxID=3451555 RepID=UPI003F754853
MIFKRSFFLLPLIWVVLVLGSSCQRKGILRCPKIDGKGSSTEVTGKDGKSVQATRVAFNKNGRVKRKKNRLKFWQ